MYHAKCASWFPAPCCSTVAATSGTTNTGTWNRTLPVPVVEELAFVVLVVVGFLELEVEVEL